jgi:hypothetical protein
MRWLARGACVAVAVYGGDSGSHQQTRRKRLAVGYKLVSFRGSPACNPSNQPGKEVLRMDSITNDFSNPDPDEIAYLKQARETYKEKKEKERRQAEAEAREKQKYASVRHTTLHIQPALPCNWCERTTTLAQIEWVHASGWYLDVCCFEHGLCEQTPETEIASVRRFIVGYHDGKGSAAVVDRCALADVPGFALEEEEEEEAFRAWELLNDNYYCHPPHCLMEESYFRRRRCLMGNLTLPRRFRIVDSWNMGH